MLFLLALLALPAHGGGLQPRTSREALPAREIERPLVLPKGWTELRVQLQRGRGEGPDLPLRLTTAATTIIHGLLPGHHVRLTAPWHQAQGGGMRATGPGDVQIGWRTSLLRREPPNQAVALELSWTAPSAPDASEIPLGTGTPELTAALSGRRQLGGLGLTAWASATRRFPGRSGITELQMLDPGDRADLAVEALLQLAPLVVAAEPRLIARRSARVDDQTVDDGGVGAVLGLRATLQVTRAFDLEGVGSLTLRELPGGLAEPLTLGSCRSWGGAVTGRF